MNPYYNAVVAAIRTLAVLLFIYYVETRGLAYLKSLSADTLFIFCYRFGSPVLLYFLAKPIAWLATSGIK